MATLQDVKDKLEQILQELRDLPQLIKVAGNQVSVVNLSEITEQLGLIQAGEFRSGNGKDPGFGFSGVRIGYPSFSYGGELWNIAGVENDALQFGVRASDGKALAGGGDVTLDELGITLTATSDSINSIKWKTGSNTTGLINSYASGLLCLLTLDANNPQAPVADTNARTTVRATGDTEKTAEVNLVAALINDGPLTPVDGELTLYNDGTNNDLTWTVISGTDNTRAAFGGAVEAGVKLKVYGVQIFSGDGSGLPYGSFYGNDIAWSQASAVQDTWYRITDSDISDGQLNSITHDGSGRLIVSKAGRYKIDYHVVASSSIANKQLQTGVAINGTVTFADAIDHETATSAGGQKHLSSAGIFDLAASSTIDISIRTTDAGTPDIGVEHINVIVLHVGGT